MTAGTLLDANLLCLLAVGRERPAAIGSHPRLKVFAGADFDNLVAIIDRLGDPVLCPHVLAETSNLIAYRQSVVEQRRWREALAEIVVLSAEHSRAAVDVVNDREFGRLGMTDAVLMMLAADHRLSLVSDDLHLCLAAERRGLRTVNYNYVRDGVLRIDQL